MSSSSSYTTTRHYYTTAQRIEQSVDVYEPVILKRDNDNDNDNNTTEVQTVLLVMGSAWLGHVPWIYWATNWWNSSGPATIAKLCINSSTTTTTITTTTTTTTRYRCISIRHSGGFPKYFLPKLTWHVVFALVAVSIASGLILAPVCLGVGLLCFVWHWQAQGSAEFTTMMQDVATAIQYIHEDLGYSKERVIVGGYSSGGHVLACLLTQPNFDHHQLDKLQLQTHQTQQQQQQEENSQSPESEEHSWIQGIFYLSGVLSLDSFWIKVLVRSIFDNPVPSPYPKGHPPHSSLLTRPHLVLGCRSETFGIPILDSAFCSKEHTEWLLTFLIGPTESSLAPARCVLVESNHWSILSSKALRQALQVELPLLQLLPESSSSVTLSHQGLLQQEKELVGEEATNHTLSDPQERE